jgi:hypothetical protein
MTPECIDTGALSVQHSGSNGRGLQLLALALFSTTSLGGVG